VATTFQEDCIVNTLRPVLILLLITCVVSLPSSLRAEEDQSLFVNLTSDETNRAVMAVALATMVLSEEGIPATIFLNVDGVRLADKRMPQKKNAEGNDPQEMLAAFIEAGGTVMICPMCMANVGGMASEDVIDGIALAKADITFPALFQKNATVLSY